MTTHEYTVEVLPEDGGPEPEPRERFATIGARRLQKLEEQRGTYPEAGDAFDFLDAFEGKFIEEMSDAELEATPPTQVDFEVVDVAPVEPAGSGSVAVKVRIPF